jgi:hypothetical protein
VPQRFPFLAFSRTAAWSVLGLVLAVLHLTPPVLEAAEYYENFAGANGELDGRKTAEGFGDWVAEPKFVVKDGSLVLSSSDPESESAWFSLPPLEGKSLLRVTIRCHSRGSSDGAHLAFGFTPFKGLDQNIFNKAGALWVIDRSDSYVLGYLTGPGATNQFVGEGWYADFYRDPNHPTEHSIEYNLKTGEVTATVRNNGNTRTLVSDVPVNWAGNNGHPIPLDNLASFGVSFHRQTGMDLGEAETASITEITIELID